MDNIWNQINLKNKENENDNNNRNTRLLSDELLETLSIGYKDIDLSNVNLDKLVKCFGDNVYQLCRYITWTILGCNVRCRDIKYAFK